MISVRGRSPIDRNQAIGTRQNSAQAPRIESRRIFEGARWRRDFMTFRTASKVQLSFARHAPRRRGIHEFLGRQTRGWSAFADHDDHWSGATADQSWSSRQSRPERKKRFTKVCARMVMTTSTTTEAAEA